MGDWSSSTRSVDLYLTDEKMIQLLSRNWMLIADKPAHERIFLANFACRVFQQYRRNLSIHYGITEGWQSSREVTYLREGGIWSPPMRKRLNRYGGPSSRLVGTGHWSRRKAKRPGAR